MGPRRRARPSAIVEAAFAAASIPLVVLHVYVSAVTVAAVRAHRRRPGPDAMAAPVTRFAVLVPAHDEEHLIGETVASLRAVDYPPELFSVVVVADHCRDATAEIARRGGATVLEHESDDERGKGAALRHGVAWLVDVDAVVVVDADTVVDAGLLRAFDLRLREGAAAVQAYYDVRDADSSELSALRSAALAVRHYVRPLGRTALGASSGLYGNGMAFDIDVLRRNLPSDHLTEDVETQLELVLAGRSVEFAPEVRVRAEMPDSLAASTSQHERWERGRVDLARRYVRHLILRGGGPSGRRARLARIDSAVDLLTPPLSVVVAATALSVVVSAGLAVSRPSRVTRTQLVVMMLGLAVQLGQVPVALRLVGAPVSTYKALLRAPRAIAWKVALWLRMLTHRGRVTWRRTARNPEGNPRDGGSPGAHPPD